ncbi:AraC family ligand binding domain-containing protein [Aeromonas caviae]
MAQDNQFIFAHSQHLASLTALRVNMTEFRYDRHAHEEYSFGVTLAGRQNFFCHGGAHSSPAGSVIQFNPGDVHDGHAGDNASLDYTMLYIPPHELTPLFADAAGERAMGTYRLLQPLVRDEALSACILEEERTGSSDGENVAAKMKKSVRFNDNPVSDVRVFELEEGRALNIKV